MHLANVVRFIFWLMMKHQYFALALPLSLFLNFIYTIRHTHTHHPRTYSNRQQCQFMNFFVGAIFISLQPRTFSS